MLPIHTILHATDFSEQASNAFGLACALARDYGARLIVLHVYPTPVLPTIDGPPIPVSMEFPREETLAELRKIRPADPALAVKHALLVGDPTYEILQAAERFKADLIVMGTHGRGGLSRLVMGSVAEAVGRQANCPVLTVRSKVSDIRPRTAETAQPESVAAR
jgi:nucleotide-binding universal stress UspA family protein